MGIGESVGVKAAEQVDKTADKVRETIDKSIKTASTALNESVKTGATAITQTGATVSKAAVKTGEVVAAAAPLLGRELGSKAVFTFVTNPLFTLLGLIGVWYVALVIVEKFQKLRLTWGSTLFLVLVAIGSAIVVIWVVIQTQTGDPFMSSGSTGHYDF